MISEAAREGKESVVNLVNLGVVLMDEGDLKEAREVMDR